MIHPRLCLEQLLPYPSLKWGRERSQGTKIPSCLSATGIFTQPQNVPSCVWNNSGGSPVPLGSHQPEETAAEVFGESAEPAGEQKMLSQGWFCLLAQLLTLQGQHFREISAKAAGRGSVLLTNPGLSAY